MSIHFSGVTVRLGDVDVLRDITVNWDARTISVVGENGSGKSSFARAIAGLVSRSAGDLTVLGFDPDRDGRELRRRVAMVFSNPDAQIIMPTVAEDVAFSLRADRLSTAEVAKRVSAALDRCGLTALADRSPHELSGGQKQLLAVCGALVREPELVIADEPTAYLDARNSRIIADHLLSGEHRLVLATHDLTLARRCELAVLIEGGRVVASGEAQQVIRRYEESFSC